MTPFTRWCQLVAAVALGLMWLAPSAADAATLKRVHSGTTNVPSATVVNVTLDLPSANVTKAFVFCPTRTSSGNSSHRVTCTLSTNNLAIDGGTNVTNANTVSWFVAEFESGVSVVSGTSTFNAGSATPSAAPVIGTVDCSKSFVVLGGEQSDTALTSINDEQFTFLGVLGTFAAPCAVTAGTTTSTLTLSRLATTNAATVAWQVVTMDGATVVARNTSTIATNATQSNPSLPTAADPTKSFILMSRQGGTAIAGVENLYMVRGDLDTCTTTCTKVIFKRDLQTGAANTQVDVAYEVITLNDGGTVQRPASATASSGTTATMGAAGNIAAIDRSAAVPFFTGSVGGATSSNLYLDKGSWTAAFPSTTQLQFTRGISSAVVGTVNWFVVSFYKCPTTYSRLCSMGVTGGNDSATVSWSPIYDPACLSGSTPTKCEAVVLRSQSTIAFAPSNGTAYAVGAQPTAGVFVAFNGTAQTFTENPANLTNGTQYFYRVYPKVNGATTYMTDISNTVSQVNVTPSANANLAWSYMTTGGSTLNAPSAGNGRVYVASNGSKMIALNSSTGVELATPLITNGAIQSYLSWFPVSGGTNEAVVAGDQIGRLTSMDAVTGARNWTVQLPVDATGFIQATLSAQLLAYTQGGYKCDTGAGFSGTYTTDLIYVASRDNGLTANNVWAVRATDGQTQWTFTPGTAMDRAVGQPYVDYCRDRLWVSTGNNAGQKSLWVVNTLTGTEVTSFPSVGNQVDSAPTPSADGTTVYVGDATGNLYAFDAATNGTTKKYSLLLAGTSPTIKGYIWEDWTTPGKLYIPVITNGSAGVWCVQDNGSALVACPSWTTNPRTGSSTLAEPLVTGTAIFFPVSTGIIYQLNTSDGTLYGGTGHPFTVESGVALGGISTEDWTQLYVGTSSGRSYRINLTGGNLP